jgi:hypothetical protein
MHLEHPTITRALATGYPYGVRPKRCDECGEPAALLWTLPWQEDTIRACPACMKEVLEEKFCELSLFTQAGLLGAYEEE